jgi:hypothetical protein
MNEELVEMTAEDFPNGLLGMTLDELDNEETDTDPYGAADEDDTNC